MEKIEFQLKQPKNKTIEHNGYEIHISPVLGAGEQMALISSYITSILSEKVYDEDGDVDVQGYFKREISQMIYIINTHTNISVPPEIANTFFDSEVWASIKLSIDNYKEFRERQALVLTEVLQKIERETSLNKLIFSLIEEYSPVIENLLKTNPEEIKELQENTTKMLKELEESQLVKAMG